MKEKNPGDQFEKHYGPAPSAKSVANRIADIEARLSVGARCLALQRMLDTCLLQEDRDQQLLEDFDKHPLEGAGLNTETRRVKVGRSFHSFLPKEPNMEANHSGEIRKRTSKAYRGRRCPPQD